MDQALIPQLKFKDVAYGIAEVIAAHQLLRHVRDSNGGEKLRMIAGASMAGLGYALGPELSERIQHLRKDGLSEKLKQQAMYAVGGALLGGVTAYAFADQHKRDAIAARTREEAATTLGRLLEQDAKPLVARPNDGLLSLLSAGFLGYSLFFNGKDPQERNRHLWMIGAGALGYLYAPEVMRKLAGMPVPEPAKEKAVGLYSRGTIAFGMLAGGAAGLYLGGMRGLPSPTSPVPRDPTGKGG